MEPAEEGVCNRYTPKEIEFWEDLLETIECIVSDIYDDDVFYGWISIHSQKPPL